MNRIQALDIVVTTIRVEAALTKLPAITGNTPYMIQEAHKGRISYDGGETILDLKVATTVYEAFQLFTVEEAAELTEVAINS